MLVTEEMLLTKSGLAFYLLAMLDSNIKLLHDHPFYFTTVNAFMAVGHYHTISTLNVSWCTFWNTLALFMHATSYQSLLQILSSSPESSSASVSDSADESLATLLRVQTDTVRLFLDPLPPLTLLILCFQRTKLSKTG